MAMLSKKSNDFKKALDLESGELEFGMSLSYDDRTREFMTRMIDQLRSKVGANQFEFSKHALDQSILRGISVQELREAIADGEVIEDYPKDKYGPSCLVFGLTKSRKPIHIQCSSPAREVIKIITLYQPDPEEWIDYKVRRK